MRGLVWLGRLPKWMLSLVAWKITLLALLLGGYRGKVVRANLRRAFPEWSSWKRWQTYASFQRHFAQLLVESAKLFTMTRPEASKGVTHDNRELFETLHAEGRHVLVAGGHVNNWEWSALTFQDAVPHRVMGLYKRMSDQHAERRMRESRGRMGMELVRTTEGRAWMNVARHGDPVAVIMGFDQSPADPTKCWWTEFLGTETAVFYGLEQWSRLYDMAVVFGKIRRNGPWRYTVTYELVTKNAAALNEGEVLDRCLGMLEDQIFEDPSRWLWSHRRWKHARPDSQPFHPRSASPRADGEDLT